MRRAVRALLEASGHDVDGSELAQTPDHVVDAWTRSYLDGYTADPAAILASTYDAATDGDARESIVLKDIPFHGMCPHHLLPFHGIAHVGYVPGRKLASLSALARIVDCFAHRLEIQETVTRQIAEALAEHLDARGAAVILETDQTCLTTRGVERVGASTCTEHFTGAYAEDPTLRDEFRARAR